MLELLGWHISRCPKVGLVGFSSFIKRRRYAEIAKLHSLQVLGEQNILGLQVLMHDFLFVQEYKCIDHLAHYAMYKSKVLTYHLPLFFK